MVRIYKVCHFVCVFFYRVTLLKLITDCLVLHITSFTVCSRDIEKKSLSLFFIID